MVKIKRPVLLVGDSGTSKTATIHSFLKNLDADTMVKHYLELEIVSFEFSLSLKPGALRVYQTKTFNPKTSILPSLALTDATVVMLVLLCFF